MKTITPLTKDSLESSNLRLRAEALGFHLGTHGLQVLCGVYATTEAWGFPGGGVEDGESVSDAAVRELQEETGWRMIQPVEIERLAILRGWKRGKQQKTGYHGSDTRFVVGLLQSKAERASGKDGSTGSLQDVGLMPARIVLGQLSVGGPKERIRADALRFGMQIFERCVF